MQSLQPSRGLVAVVSHPALITIFRSAYVLTGVFDRVTTSMPSRKQASVVSNFAVSGALNAPSSAPMRRSEGARQACLLHRLASDHGW